MNLLLAFLTGLVFGLGLLVSGMANPGKVLAFLDLAGRWDPSLTLVMASAIGIGLPAFAWASRRGSAWLGGPMRLPPAGAIDRRLVLGALVFGIGWGLVGFCPGPAVVAAGMLEPKALVFVLAMLAGMKGYQFIDRLRPGAAPE